MVLAALAAAGPFIYIHFFNSTPSALSLSPGTSASTSSSAAPASSTATANTAASGAVAGNPSFAGFVTTQDHGLLEVLLVFTKG